MTSLPVMVPVTDDNFDERLYLLANPDVERAIEHAPTFTAKLHFEQFGKAEKRLQVSPALATTAGPKYWNFKDIIDHAGYRFGGQSGAFPLLTEQEFSDLASYDDPPNPNDLPFWSNVLETAPNKRFLDLGCGMKRRVFMNCLYVDIYPSIVADIVISPNTRLPIHDGTIDGVCCTAVLEHVQDPLFVTNEIKRIVKPGGLIYVDWPFLQPVHGYPSHFYNATRAGLQHMFEDAFEIEHLTTYPSQDVAYTLRWIADWLLKGIEDDELRAYIGSTPLDVFAKERPEGPFYRTMAMAMSDNMKMRLACGNTLIARRKAGP